VSVYTMWIENRGSISLERLKEDTSFLAHMWFVASALSAEASYRREGGKAPASMDVEKPSQLLGLTVCGAC